MAPLVRKLPDRATADAELVASARAWRTGSIGESTKEQVENACGFMLACVPIFCGYYYYYY